MRVADGLWLDWESGRWKVSGRRKFRFVGHAVGGALRSGWLVGRPCSGTKTPSQAQLRAGEHSLQRRKQSSKKFVSGHFITDINPQEEVREVIPSLSGEARDTGSLGCHALQPKSISVTTLSFWTNHDFECCQIHPQRSLRLSYALVYAYRCKSVCSGPIRT